MQGTYVLSTVVKTVASESKIRFTVSRKISK